MMRTCLFVFALGTSERETTVPPFTSVLSTKYIWKSTYIHWPILSPYQRQNCCLRFNQSEHLANQRDPSPEIVRRNSPSESHLHPSKHDQNCKPKLRAVYETPVERSTYYNINGPRWLTEAIKLQTTEGREGVQGLGWTCHPSRDYATLLLLAHEHAITGS